MVAYGVQTITGFGAMVISVPLGAQLMGINELLLLLLPLSIAQCGYIAIRHRAAIDWRLLARWIIPIMGTGTAVGAVLSGELSGVVLRRALAVLILVLSLFELYVLSKPDLERKALPVHSTALGLLGAGVMHGIYATGGPLLVYTVGRRVPDKAVFRSTLVIVWLLLNSALIAYFFFDGRYRSSHTANVALLLPGVIVGIIVGERLHTRLDGRRFRQVTFGFLAIAAIALLVR